MTDRHQSPSYPLRISSELKYQVTKAAFAMGRSFNAEVTARLQSSFESPTSDLPAEVKAAVAVEAKSRNCTESEALTRLVLAGQSKGGAVLNLHIAPGTTAKDLIDSLNASMQVVPPNATIVVETKR